MAPKAQIKAAFKAMKDIGISEEKTKPALKKLLKLFDKNWALIEEENYRVLADAIFEYEESEAAEQEKKKAENTNQEEHLQDDHLPDEPERPLKRLRLKHQAQPATGGSCALKIPKPEPGEPEVSPSQQVKNKGKQPITSLNTGASTGRLQQPRDAAVKDKSQALQIKEPNAESGTRPSGKLKKPVINALIKPKDEPFTDDMLVEPLAVLLPDCTNKEAPVHTAYHVGSQVEQSSKPTRSVGAIEEGMGRLPTSTEQEKQLEEVVVSGRTPAPARVDIAASTLGEVKISLSCNSGPTGHEIHLPNIEAVLKKANDNCLRTYKIKDPEFCVKKVMKEFCDCAAELGTTTNGVKRLEGCEGQEVCATENGSLNGDCSENVGHVAVATDCALTNTSAPPLAFRCTQVEAETRKIATVDDSNDKSAGVVDTNQRSIVVVHPCETSDITKGQEAVKISLEKSNCEFLPSFHYIFRNVILDKAEVKNSLSQIGDEDCCISCHSDCLLSPAPCNCAERNGGESAYSSDGLIREEFLDECISIARNPQRHCPVYCKECPLERLKNEDMPDPCKGHLKRKFIRECGIRCGCSQNCGNRLVQRGVRCNLQVFWTPEGKGWGLRTLEDLPKGAFVCEYVGEILTCLELHERNQNRGNNKNSYSVLLDTDWGSRALNEEEFLCLDASFYGNVARFINHRCSDSNLIEIPVELETPSHHYYHVALFTTRRVNAFEELTWDYGVDFDDNEQHIQTFSCQCRSEFCRNMKRSSRSRFALALQ